jgi:hypothetical protein
VTSAHERKRPGSPEILPNYRFFNFFIAVTIGGVAHLAYPKRPVRDVGKNPPVIRWGTPVELAVRDSAIRRVHWVDDSLNGLSGRTITSPEDLLGAEGVVGNRKYRFELILEVGKNQVVYGLFCNENQTRVAYGFSRKLFMKIPTPMGR